MGFFAPQFPNRTTIGGEWYVDTAPLLTTTDLDFFDFHAYPDSDIGIAEIAENFGILEFDRKEIFPEDVIRHPVLLCTRPDIVAGPCCTDVGKVSVRNEYREKLCRRRSMRDT